MESLTLQFLWYLVFGFTVFAYAALDGFDIGVGCLHLFAKNDHDRRIFINAIGPVWDGNSLWVVISIGALLAGFPPAFATLLSSLYMPMMILIFGYIYRAVAIEFRSKVESQSWRLFWDVLFSLSSFMLAIGLGIVLANLIRGLPIDHSGVFVADLGALFSPYALLLGLYVTSLYMLHGALFLNMKTQGALNRRLRAWVTRTFWLFCALSIVVNIYTHLYEPQVTSLVFAHPFFWGLVYLGLVGLVAIYWAHTKGNDGWAFLSSFLVIASLTISLALGTYPYLVRSSLAPEANSLTIYNASSSDLTLKILLGIACAGVPLFLFYLSYAYRVFRGKVELDTMSY